MLAVTLTTLAPSTRVEAAANNKVVINFATTKEKSTTTSKATPTKAPTEKELEASVNEVVHGNVAFDEIKYERPDKDAFLKELDQIETMMKNGEAAKTVLDEYDKLGNKLLEFSTAANYVTIQNYLDVTNTYYATEVAYLSETIDIITNRYISLTEDILASSKYAKEAKKIWSQEDLLSIDRASKMMDEKTIELGVKEQQLENEYLSASATVTIKVDGKDMTISEILASDMEYADKLNYYNTYIYNFNQKTGEIYLDLVDVRKQISEILGFDSYADYCYFSFDRDYTKEDAQNLHTYVKQYIVPVFNDLVNSFTQDEIATLNSLPGDINSYESVYLKFFKEVSPDLKKAYDYMKKYKLYNFDASPVKANLSYTTLLYSYHEPYMNIYPSGTYLDISTFIHEFGHYNAYFKHDMNLSSILDIVEIHSQGLEVLFTPYYDTAYGKEAARSIVKNNFATYLQILIEGCLHDEFQQYVFEHDLKSVKELNEAFFKLQCEYGLASEGMGVTESYSWCLVTHTFAMPFYYISYATSLVPALEIFEKSLTNRKTAIKTYINLVNQGTEETFLNTLKSAGLGSPFYEGTIAAIGEAIGDYFGLFTIEEQTTVVPAA